MSRKATKQEILDHFNLYMDATINAFNNLPENLKHRMLDSINEKLLNLDRQSSGELIRRNPDLYEELQDQYQALFEYAVKLSTQFRMNENKKYVFNHVSYRGHQRVLQFNE